MEQIRRIWNYWLAKPFIWLSCYLFQPAKFKREFEIEGFMKLKRIGSMLGLSLLMFLYSYIFAVIASIVWHALFTGLASKQFSFDKIFVLDPNLIKLLLPIAWATVQGIIIGILVGIVLGIRFGITVGIALGITLGIAIGNSWGIALDNAWSIALNITWGITGVTAWGGIVGGAVGGFIGSITGGFTASITNALVEDTKGADSENTPAKLVEDISENSLENIPVKLTEDTPENSSENILSEPTEDTPGNNSENISMELIEDAPEVIAEHSIYDLKSILSIIVSIIAGLIVGTIAGLIVGSIAGTSVGGIPGLIIGGIPGCIAGGIAGSIMGGIVAIDLKDGISKAVGDIVRRSTKGIAGKIVGNILSDVDRVPLGISLELPDEYNVEDFWGVIRVIIYLPRDIWKDLREVSWGEAATDSWESIKLSFIGGFAGGILGIVLGILVLCIALIIALVIALPFALNVIGSIVLAITLIILLILASRLVLSRRLFSILAITLVILISLVLPSEIIKLPGSNIVNLLPITVVDSLSRTIGSSLPDTVDIIGRIFLSIILVTAFTVIYILCYYRLPLYPVSGLAFLGTYFATLRNKSQVFTYLHSSSLYWDEIIFLPLPGLKRILLIAAEQKVEQALKEIDFIVHERPQQIAVARAASLEIAIHDLEICDNLHKITRASQRIAEILLQETGFIDSKSILPFARLNDASRDAERYYSPLSWQARSVALVDMATNLKKVYPNTAFKDAQLNKRLGAVINRWLEIVRQEQKKLENTLEKTGKIFNPYNPGQVLELRNSLFKGRLDLVQQLEEALSKGNRRPTFLLNGERRMGKSSTLKQLPNLLGARYLPIFYDLQSPKVLSSTVALLNTIAEGISKMMVSRGLVVKKLEYERLQEAGRKNEAAVYGAFEDWLEGLERVLEQEDRVLLLVFDEFEKLEEAKHDGYLKLRLLQDWFRSVIQNRPRIALLFSGVRTFSEMGSDWAGYFVNVETLRVSFLKPVEAHKLITEPTPNFMSKEIFSEDVVEEIIRVTGCHPFLIQAICSKLIDNLNADNRNQAEIQDVAITVNQILESWDGYFRDLWNRTDQDQKTCLFIINSLNESDMHQIEKQGNLDERTVYRALQKLLKRDLVLYEKGNFGIAAPVFSQWVEHNKYN